MLAKNKSGWCLLDYLPVKEDIGDVDRCDLKIAELACV